MTQDEIYPPIQDTEFQGNGYFTATVRFPGIASGEMTVFGKGRGQLYRGDRLIIERVSRFWGVVIGVWYNGMFRTAKASYMAPAIRYYVPLLALATIRTRDSRTLAEEKSETHLDS